MSNEDEIEYETVEIPSHIMENVRENCEDHGFPTAEGLVRYAIQYYMHNEPDASEERIKKLVESRRQANNGEVVPLEEVVDEFDLD